MEKPILFNTEMVKAILDGRKTQTRRVIKPRDPWKSESDGSPAYVPALLENGEWGWLFDGCTYGVIGCSPYQPGDRLWVKETWRETGIIASPYSYRADEKVLNLIGEDGRVIICRYKWRPSIHMPKEAARIFLRVTNVRVERLQDIEEDDIKAEGIEYHQGYDIRDIPLNTWDYYRRLFRDLWNSTIKKQDFDRYGWGANPWVWVIEFERVGS